MNSILSGEHISAEQIHTQPKNTKSTGNATSRGGTTTSERPDSYHNNIAPENMSALMKNITNTSVEFTNSTTDEVSYISIIDKTTNEVLRTFPTEEMRDVLNKIDEHSGCYIDTDI